MSRLGDHYQFSILHIRTLKINSRKIKYSSMCVENEGVATPSQGVRDSRDSGLKIHGPYGWFSGKCTRFCTHFGLSCGPLDDPLLDHLILSSALSAAPYPTASTQVVYGTGMLDSGQRRFLHGDFLHGSSLSTASYLCLTTLVLLVYSSYTHARAHTHSKQIKTQRLKSRTGYFSGQNY